MFLSCLRQSFVLRYEQTLFFVWKKPLVLGGANKKQCGVRRFLIFPVAGRQNFQHW